MGTSAMVLQEAYDASTITSKAVAWATTCSLRKALPHYALSTHPHRCPNGAIVSGWTLSGQDCADYLLERRDRPTLAASLSNPRMCWSPRSCTSWTVARDYSSYRAFSARVCSTLFASRFPVAAADMDYRVAGQSSSATIRPPRDRWVYSATSAPS